MAKKSPKRAGGQDAYDLVVSEVAADVEKSLRSGAWHRREAFRLLVDAPRCRRASSARGGEVSGPGAQAGQDQVLTDAIAQLDKGGRYELRGEGADMEIRLRPPRAATDPPPNNNQDAPSHAGTPPSDNDASPVPAAGATNSNWEPLPAPVLVRVADLKLHPKQRLVPRMPKRQWKRFRADVAGRGVRQPILITRDNTVIDGRGRTDAASQSGQETVPAVVVDWDEEQQELHMLREALLRRQMTEDQQAMLEERLRKLEGPQMRKERAQKAGLAGGRGRPRKPDS